MTQTKISGRLSEFASRVVTPSRVIALALVVAFTAVAMQPAQAQTSADTWKSVAIIGGSTAAGAGVGAVLGGGSGAKRGAVVGLLGGTVYDLATRGR